MEGILKDLFGSGKDEPAAAPAAAAPDTETHADDADREAQREARREARKQRKADPERRRKRDDFFQRYEAGDPSEGFTAEEAIEHLAEIREELSPGEFQMAMVRTLDHLPADQREEFIALMRKYKAGADEAAKTAPAAAAASAAAAPASAAPGSSGDPFGGLLTGLLGGTAGGASAAGAGRGGFDLGALFDDLKGGASAPDVSAGDKPTEADFKALINSPLGKAVLGGLAAYGMQAAQADDDDTAPKEKRG